jgi:hypothetical protein
MLRQRTNDLAAATLAIAVQRPVPEMPSRKGDEGMRANPRPLQDLESRTIDVLLQAKTWLVDREAELRSIAEKDFPTYVAQWMMTRLGDLASAIVLLHEHQLSNEVAALGRIVCEVAITATYIGSDESKAERFALTGVFRWDEHRRSPGTDLSSFFVTGKDLLELQEILGEARKKFGLKDTEELKLPGLRKMATDAGLLKLYNVSYKYLCAGAHCDMRSLTRAGGHGASDKEFFTTLRMCLWGVDVAIKGLAIMLGEKPPEGLIPEMVLNAVSASPGSK